MKVLIAEDDEIARRILERMLTKWGYEVIATSDGREAWRAIQGDNPPPMAILDWMMPLTNGVELCRKIRNSPILKSIYIIFLTSKQQHDDLVFALESGGDDYIIKPFHSDELRARLRAAERIIQLQASEKELLEETLRGTIKVLTELLSLINPEAFGRSLRITRYVRQIASHTKEEVDTWEVETAAMLSQIGAIIVPWSILEKIYKGMNLKDNEKEIFNTQPLILSDLICKIPRLEKVAEIIAFQRKHFDGSGFPPDGRKGKGIPLGSRLLKVAFDFDALESTGNGKETALYHLKTRTGLYDPEVLDALEKVIGIEANYEIRSLSVYELTDDMMLADDIRTVNGSLMIARGQEVSRPILARLRKLVSNQIIKEPIRVVTAL